MIEIKEAYRKQRKSTRNLVGNQNNGVSSQEKRALIEKYESLLRLIADFGEFMTKEHLVKLMKGEKSEAGVSFILDRLYKSRCLNTFTISLNAKEQEIYGRKEFIVYTFSKITRQVISNKSKAVKAPTKKALVMQSFKVSFISTEFIKTLTVAKREGVPLDIYVFVNKTKGMHTALGINNFSNKMVEFFEGQEITSRLKEERRTRFYLNEMTRLRKEIKTYESSGDTRGIAKAKKKVDLLELKLKDVKLFALRKTMKWLNDKKRYENVQGEVITTFNDLQNWNVIIKRLTVKKNIIHVKVAILDPYNRKMSPPKVAEKIVNTRYFLEALFEYYRVDDEITNKVTMDVELFSYKDYDDQHRSKVGDLIASAYDFRLAENIKANLKYRKLKA